MQNIAFICKCRRGWNLGPQLPNTAGMQVQNSDKFLPLRDMTVDVEIRDSIAIIRLNQSYLNPSDPIYCEKHKEDGEKSESTPIEVSFKFPKENKSIISEMKLSVGEKTVEAKIMQNEKAQEKYDDAIAAGNAGAILKQGQDYHQIDLGNINQGQTASVELVIIQPLDSSGGCFDFRFPSNYYPKYTESIQGTQGESPSFDFKVILKSTYKKFSDISFPKKFEILEQSPTEVMVQRIGGDFKDIEKDVHFLFRQEAMDSPNLVYQQKDGLVAVMAQFLPTFEE